MYHFTQRNIWLPRGCSLIAVLCHVSGLSRDFLKLPWRLRNIYRWIGCWRTVGVQSCKINVDDNSHHLLFEEFDSKYLSSYWNFWLIWGRSQVGTLLKIDLQLFDNIFWRKWYFQLYVFYYFVFIILVLEKKINVHQFKISPWTDSSVIIVMFVIGLLSYVSMHTELWLDSSLCTFSPHSCSASCVQLTENQRLQPKCTSYFNTVIVRPCNSVLQGLQI